MISAIIQARLASTRLARKTLAFIEDKTMLEHLIDRIKASRVIDDIIVATTDAPEDQAIVYLAKALGVKTYCGSADDVLDRIFQAATLFKATTIVRVTPDNPFTDPKILLRAVDAFRAYPHLDYLSNKLNPTFPEGLDVEIFSFEALAIAHQSATLPSEREHVTPFMWKNPHTFSLAGFTHCEDLSHMRWTVDYEADLRFAREVYRRLYRTGEIFYMADVLRLLNQEPSLANINKGIIRHEGYYRALSEEIIQQEKS